MNPQSELNGRASATSVLRKLVPFMHPEHREAVLLFITDFAEHLPTGDRLLRLIEVLGYMVLSVHDIPQKLADERKKYDQSMCASTNQVEQIKFDVAALTVRCVHRLHKASQQLIEERARYEETISGGVEKIDTSLAAAMTRLEQKIDRRLAGLPTEVAKALLKVVTQTIRDYIERIPNYQVVLGLVAFVFVFLAGYCLALVRH